MVSDPRAEDRGDVMGVVRNVDRRVCVVQFARRKPDLIRESALFEDDLDRRGCELRAYVAGGDLLRDIGRVRGCYGSVEVALSVVCRD